MRIEREGDGTRTVCAGELARSCDEGLVTDVNAIEVADRDHRAARPGRRVLMTANDVDHAANLAERRRYQIVSASTHTGATTSITPTAPPTNA